MGLGRSHTADVVGRLARLPAELAKAAFYVGLSMGKLVLFPSRHGRDGAPES
jgi:hypothetical protein